MAGIPRLTMAGEPSITVPQRRSSQEAAICVVSQNPNPDTTETIEGAAWADAS